MEKSWNLKRKLDRSCKARILNSKMMWRDLPKLVASRRSLLLTLKSPRNLEFLFHIHKVKGINRYILKLIKYLHLPYYLNFIPL
jgi:hypothetical protein